MLLKFGADDGCYRRKLKSADPFQVINDLLLFVFKLSRVVNMLPGTAATEAKMLTEWLAAIWGKSCYADSPTFKKTAFDSG